MPERHGWFSLDYNSFFLTTALLAMIAVFSLFYMYSKDVTAIENSLKLSERSNNNLTSRAINLDLKTLFANLRTTAHHPEIQTYFKTGNPQSRKDLEREFLNLVTISTVYDQIRLLDTKGMELVRVNYNSGNPAAVPHDKLQNKSSRYYFIEAMKMGPNEIYVSPFDLNVENGSIEQPLKPMIRVCTPVYDKDGARVGIVILNYLGQQILDGITNVARQPFTQTMLLNSDGYWLLASDKNLEWTFMYPDRKSESFAHQYPVAWERISAFEKGQFQLAEGMYTFSTISIAPNSDTGEGERSWKIVNFVPSSTTQSSMGALTRNYAVVSASILIIILFGAGTRARFVRVRETSREQLEKAHKKAEEANEAKSDFLARMSHEIRTPMNAIVGLTHLSLKTDLSPKQADYLNKILMSSKTLLGIINDILDFSKIEADRLDIEHVPFTLDDVINNIVNMLGLQAEEKGLEFLLMVKSDVPNMLIGDPLRLGQVLLNLTGNAIKFTQQGEVILCAETVEEKENTATVRFTVKDSGIGISQDKIDSLFQPFSQADGSISRQFGGTGLGLSISKRLVEMMGGTMTLTSELGKGSAFEFTIPFQLQQSQGTQLSYPESIRGMRVLVADDSRMARIVLVKVLTSFTFETLAVGSGEEAIQAIRDSDASHPFGLVITDWRMPDMDGLTLVRELKKDTSLSNPPKTIMLTAYGHAEIRHRAEQAGVDGFMLKPFNRSILFDTIMSIFADGDFHTIVPATSFQNTGVPSNVPGAHILLAEDNEINQQVARELLESSDVTVSIANNGKEALEMLAENEYDAVLMDIQMPVMDGFQTVKAIRQQPQFMKLPVIAMTAHALVGDKDKSLLAGMNDHVTKPIDPDHLMEVLSQWLPSSRREAPRRDDTAGKSHGDFSFPALPGIDIEAGLNRVRGNTDLYVKMLKGFANESDDMNRNLLSLSENNDEDQTRHLVHSMKGVAGNIGAEHLHRLLSHMETALNTEAEIGSVLFQEYATERERVVQGIRTAFPVESSQKTADIEPKDEDLQQIFPQLEAMIELLQRHDAEAMHLLKTITPTLERSAPTLAMGLQKALGEFDFASAMTMINRTIQPLHKQETADEKSTHTRR